MLGPLMLELGVLPEVTQAVSSVAFLFTSVSSLAQFVMLARVPLDYAGALAALGAVTSLIG